MDVNVARRSASDRRSSLAGITVGIVRAEMTHEASLLWPGHTDSIVHNWSF